jgi:flavin reductase (DIM6/NTAB) family NADH-FMN oxidoreductase RutF
VNVLGAHQVLLSERFATTGGDKFTGVAWRRTLADMPLLDDTAANFTCRNVHRFPGGDHLILVGEVLAFEQGACMPLVYANGRYTSLSAGAEADQASAKSRKMIASR